MTIEYYVLGVFSLLPSKMDPEDANAPTTRLLTLLNVSALKSRKRPVADSYPREKLNKRRCHNSAAVTQRPEREPSELADEATLEDPDVDEQDSDDNQGDQNNPACEPLPVALLREAKPRRVPTSA